MILRDITIASHEEESKLNQEPNLNNDEENQNLHTHNEN